MQLEKFDNFLHNQPLYQELEHFWSSEISKITHTFKTQSWVGDEYANGKKMYDGNPIFSLYLPRKKQGIRIIQTEIDPVQLDMVCWLDHTFDQDNNKIDEIVISLQLNSLTLHDAKKIGSLFFKNELKKKDIEDINAKYEEILSSRIDYLTNFIKNIKETKIPSIRSVANELRSPLSQMQRIQKLSRLHSTS